MTPTPPLPTPPPHGPRRFLDPDHAWFRPAWRRWAVTILPLAWAAFEFATGSPTWGMLFGALGLYAGWVLIVTYKPGQGS